MSNLKLVDLEHLSYAKSKQDAENRNTFATQTALNEGLNSKLGSNEAAVNALKVNNHTVDSDVPANAKFTDTVYENATTTTAGLMSATDKEKLDNLENSVGSVTGVKGDSESNYRTGNINITKADIGLGNVNNTADSEKSVANAAKVNNHTVDSDVPSEAKFTDTTYSAMSASEATTGTATTARTITAKVLADYVAACIANLVNSAPETLDTLQELADALGNDPNFATTMATALGNKLDKAGGTVTGNLTVNGTITGNLTGNVTGNAATATKATQDKNGEDITTTYLPLTGGRITGVLNIGASGVEGGEIHLEASTDEPTQNGIILDQCNSIFRVFGIPSKDGTTKTGPGTPLEIDPYAKTIVGGYTLTGNVTGSSGSCTGNAATATKAGQVDTAVMDGVRMRYGNYGVFFRNDGTNFWILKTASGQPTGTFDNTRPLAINLSTGVCNINGNAVTATSAASCTGNAATATKINGKTIPVVSSFDSTTGTLALTSLS